MKAFPDGLVSKQHMHFTLARLKRNLLMASDQATPLCSKIGKTKSVKPIEVMERGHRESVHSQPAVENDLGILGGMEKF
jgi:hypothetical protein